MGRGAPIAQPTIPSRVGVRIISYGKNRE